MSRRRASDSSLELLLDTITNTFGGVLFVAMLVALMLRSAPQETAPTADDPVERARLEVELDSLRQQAADLRSRPELSRPQATNDSSPDEVSPEMLLKELLSVIEERTTVLEATSTHQTAAATAADRAAELAAAADEAARSLERASSELGEQEAEANRLTVLLAELDRRRQQPSDVRTVGLPLLTATDKQQVAIMLRYGRLYMMHFWRNGTRLGPNTVDFVVTPGPPQVARARPSGGSPVEEESIGATLRELLAAFPKENWVVATVIHIESFDSFALLKRALVDAGYTYEPITILPGKGIVDTGGKAEGQ